jgi:hypothetical protein
VYKIDRLTRSPMDFSRLVEIFDEYGVTFVGVTQSFNTTTSMGRLTLNVLLSFAHFEREVTGERISDKIAASKKKGLWMSGAVPMGYQRIDKKLSPEPEEQKTGRFIFEQYLECASVRALELYLYTGCRKMEILQARLDDVDFDKEQILLRETKGGENGISLLMIGKALTHKSTDSTRVYARLTNHAPPLARSASKTRVRRNAHAAFRCFGREKRTVDFISDKVSALLKGAEQANDTPSGPKGTGNDNNTLESKMLAAIMQVMEEHQGNEGGQQPR